MRFMLILFLGIMLLGGLSGIVSAQDPFEDPFVCDGKAFVVQDVSASLNNVTLDGTANLTPLFPPAGIEYNNLGYRSTDGLLYAVQLQGTGYGDGIVQVIRINATGAIQGLGLPAGLPTGVQTRFDAGDISSDGNTMYITFGARSGDPQTTLGYHLKLYKLDLGSWAGPPNPLPAVTVVNITGDDAWVNDWAYNPNDGNLYGGDQWGTSATSNSQLSVLDPDTGVRTDYDVGFGPTGAFGAAWHDSVRGTVFLYQNTGTIYEIDVSDLGGAGPSINNSWTADASTRNDGTFCAGPPAAPAIDIEKSTNGQDADTPPGPTVTVGDTVTWEYVVTNTGNVPLTSISVTDDQGVTPVYQSGDDTDGILQVGETWIYNATGTATLGQYANNGTVNGDYDGVTVNDTDPSHYRGEEAACPAIDIEKCTNGQDADEPPGPTVTIGDPVTWDYVVTNTGNVPLTNITVTDDQGVTPIYQSGDDTDGILQVGETWRYKACGTATCISYVNLGTATGDYDGVTVSDSDPSHYRGEEAACPAIDIEKCTNGQDADTPPGPTVTIGDHVTWDYVVTNTGNVPLTNITVTDDQGVTPIYQSGDDTDGILQPGETWRYRACGTAACISYANLGTATGDYDGVTVSDCDSSHYIGVAPEIDIEEFVNGEDADEKPGPSYVVGAPIEWTFVVTNIGNVTLSNIVVTSDPGLPVTSPKDTLEPGETMTCTATSTAILGQYGNQGTATGYYDGVQATDTDPSYYFGIDAPGVGTPGYWMNHPEAWPVDNITIGGVEYTKDEAIAIMNDPVVKDKTFTMFPAVVAARLNVEIGNEYEKCAIEAGTNFTAAADAWMMTNPLASNVKASSDAWQKGEIHFEWLDWYNNGYFFWAPERY